MSAFRKSEGNEVPTRVRKRIWEEGVDVDGNMMKVDDDDDVEDKNICHGQDVSLIRGEVRATASQHLAASRLFAKHASTKMATMMMVMVMSVIKKLIVFVNQCFVRLPG